MVSSKKPGSSEIDSILHELKSRGGAVAPAKRSVDDILSELGKGGAPKANPPAPAPPPAPPPAPEKEPAPITAQAPPRPAETAPAAQGPAEDAGEAPPRLAETAPAAQGPAEDAGEAPPQLGFMADETGPDNAPSAIESTGARVMYTAARDEEKTLSARQLRKKKELEATIYDIDLEAERDDMGPRVGKAAALDKVDPDKFRGDTELLRWFAGEGGDIPTGKKEQKKLEKEKKRREAAEKRAAKRRQRKDDDYYDLDLTGEADEDDFFKPGRDGEKDGEAPLFDFSDAEPISKAGLTGTAQDPGLARENPATAQAGLSAAQAEPALTQAEPPAAQDAQATQAFEPTGAASRTFTPPPADGGDTGAPEDSGQTLGPDTKSFDIGADAAGSRVPTAAYTQEFGEDGQPIGHDSKALFVDEMVDDRFRQFFGETVSVDREEEEAQAKGKGRRRKKSKSRTAILTGEFGKLAMQAEQAERAQSNAQIDDDFDDYNHLQDAEAIEQDIDSLRRTLARRTVATLFLGAALLWLALSDAGVLPFPQIGLFDNDAAVFAGIYLLALLAAIIVNFTTVASGLAGLVGEPTADSAPALASVGALLQGVMLMVQTLSDAPLSSATLFGALAGFLLAFNALGKRIRAAAILGNFHLASAGYDHSAAYVLDNSTELTYNITKGLNEAYPSLLISRSTALVKGFLRQSFSQRACDRRARLAGWLLLAVALGVGAVGWVLSEDIYLTVSAFSATLCMAAPFSSSLVSGIPSHMLQKGTARVGAVVPGWSAIEELGGVNVVMAGARDIFPPDSVSLKGIKTFEKERIDLAILYAASVLIEGCSTLKNIFMGVIQGKNDMLYKVEGLTQEPQRGFTAWVQNSRIVIGTREMMQKHDIEPPAMEVEVKFVPKNHAPVYLAVSGKLFAMFIIGYSADADVRDTLHGLVRSGVSLLVDSDDMNISDEIIEEIYALAPGTVKVLGPREIKLLEPLTEYLPESEGVMTHLGTFASFIGGMRAAGSCAAAEKMANVVQMASMALACVLCVLLALSEGLTGLPVMIGLAYQLGWTLLVSALPFARKY